MKVEKEDIDASFENGSSSPSHVPPQVFARSALSGIDVISDEDDNIAQSSEVKQNPRRSLRQIGSDIEDGIDFPKHDRIVSVHTGERDRLDPTTPCSKRRKVSAPIQRSDEVVYISSSLEPDPEVTYESEHEEDLEKDCVHAQYNDSRYSLSPELITPQMPTRFKTPAIQADTIKPFQQKPSFRPSTRDTHLSAEAGLTLPDAFSPSRKKGKRDYVSGGIADTVRNWVLNAATEELQQSRPDQQVITVDTASIDPSGRAIGISDDNGERWLLVGEQSNNDAGGSAATLAKVLERRKVYVRGTYTNWKIPISYAGPGDEVTVAAQWDAG